MWIKRSLSGKITKSAKTFPAVVVTGARQTGKTSLLQRLFPNHRYVSLDIPSRAAQAEESPETFLKNYPPPLLIDEVQYAPAIFRHLKVAIDANRDANAQFILTGSQKFTLMKGVSDSLAGRCAILELETLSVNEIQASLSPLLVKPITPSSIPAILARGGYPELWQPDPPDLVTFYESYLATYLERDVRQLMNVVSLRDFERFVRACAARSGQVLDKASLARDVGITSTTCNDWLSVLQASNQIALLEPWFGNFTKRLTKAPKLYMCDSGFATFLLNLTERSLSTSSFIGAIWETAVFAELRKILASHLAPASIWMYRDSQANEIDFLVQTEGRTLALESKWAEVPTLKDTTQIQALIDYLARRPNRSLGQLEGFVICRTPELHPLKNGMKGISVGELASLFRVTK